MKNEMLILLKDRLMNVMVVMKCMKRRLNDEVTLEFKSDMLGLSQVGSSIRWNCKACTA